MSDIGNSIVIHEIEANDLGFTSLWSHSTELECGTIFLNSELPNDVFFNKLANVTCSSESMINGALTLFNKYKTTPFIYSSNYPELEDLLKKKNFTHYDTQHVLKRNAASHKINNLNKINLEDPN